MVFVLVFVFIGLVAYEVPPLIKRQEWRELTAFAVLMLIAMGLTFAYVLELPVPNPTPVIEKLISPVTRVMDRILASPSE